MKSSVRFHAALCAAALLLVPWQGFAADPVSGSGKNCDSVAEAVRAAVEKEPQKVLLFVEDFMVANEGCAAAIVTAAIEASKANADLAKQIATTATHVAPQMGPVIADAVAKLIPDQAAAVVAATQKEEDVPLPLPTTDSAENDGSTDDNRKLPTDVRGVYFIEPIGSGASQTSSNSSNGKSKDDDKSKSNDKSKDKDHSPPNHPFPVSRSSGSP